MRTREVRIAPSAERDLERLTDWLADVTSEAVALRYISRIHDRLDKLSIGSERCTIRDDNTKLRIIGILPSVPWPFGLTPTRSMCGGFCIAGSCRTNEEIEPA